MRIGIIGTGNMGRSLGVLFAGCGHEVFFGSRDAEAGAAARTLAGSAAKAGTNDEAATFGEILFYGVRGVPPQEVLSNPDVMDGKPVIDCNNREIPEDFAFSAMQGDSLAEQLATSLPRAHIVKAFNTISMEVLEHAPDTIREHGVSVYLCADDAGAKDAVRGLVEQLGFVPIDCGSLRSARMVESIGDFIRFLMMGMKRGAFSTISVRDLPAPAAQRLGGREQGA